MSKMLLTTKTLISGCWRRFIDVKHVQQKSNRFLWCNAHRVIYCAGQAMISVFSWELSPLASLHKTLLHERRTWFWWAAGLLSCLHISNAATLNFKFFKWRTVAKTWKMTKVESHLRAMTLSGTSTKSPHVCVFVQLGFQFILHCSLRSSWT